MGMLGSMALASSSVMPKSAAKVCTCEAPCHPAAKSVVTEIMQLRARPLLRQASKTRQGCPCIYRGVNRQVLLACTLYAQRMVLHWVRLLR